MDGWKSVMVMNAAMWIASAIAIATAVIVTKNGSWLWFLLVPALGGWSYREHHRED